MAKYSHIDMPLNASLSQPKSDVVARCGERVPARLWEILGASKCALEIGPDGSHTGDHRASEKLPGGIRITVRWKQSQDR